MNYKRFDKKIGTLENKRGTRDAGYDLFSKTTVTIQPHQVATLHLNVATEIPEGYVGMVCHRSSTYKTWGIRLTNNVGIIDPSYRGNNDEWLAKVINERDEAVTINAGDKVLQVIFLQVFHPAILEVDNLVSTDRGGFGTSGK